MALRPAETNMSTYDIHKTVVTYVLMSTPTWTKVCPTFSNGGSELDLFELLSGEALADAVEAMESEEEMWMFWGRCTFAPSPVELFNTANT